LALGAMIIGSLATVISVSIWIRKRLRS